MIFTFLILVSVFGHKTKYKVTNLKAHSNISLKKIPFKNYNERLVWTTKLLFCICDITNFKSHLQKFDWFGWRGEHLVEHRTFQNQNPVPVFLYHCISDGNQLFSENVGCNFYFILHIMSDEAEAAFVSGALLCVQRYRGKLDLSRSNSASCWQRINLHIYAGRK